jgi:hypothetical protein
MDTDKLLELVFYTLPAAITGGVAYYFFQMFMRNEEKKRQFALMRENQKHALPLRLQAYERLALYLERINPAKLLIRVAPLQEDKMDYQNLLIHHIEQEFEHNLTQQIYVTDECWVVLLKAKNTIIQNIRKSAMDTSVLNADKLREKLLSDQLQDEAATNVALTYLKSEVSQVLG